MNDEFPEGSEDEGEGLSEKQIARKLKIEREKKELLDSLKAGDFSTLKARVATVLNLYPAARDSDIVLCLKYWAMFQPEIYKPEAISPADLFKLERLHYVVRARAMIQNDYGLFVAAEAVRRHRKKNEQTVKAEILAEQPERPVVKVYADETGKTGKYLMVAAVWVLSGSASFRVASAIKKWRDGTPFAKREMHFARLGKSDGESLAQYLDVIKSNAEYLSFKVIGIERAKTKRSSEEVVAKLHEQMLKKGALHEVQSGRIKLPRFIEVTIDEEESLDKIALAEIKSSIDGFYSQHFPDESIKLGEIDTASSKCSTLLQLADIVAGAVNRKRNHEGERNYKCEFADLVIEKLGLVFEEGDDDLDSSTVLRL